MDAAALLSLLLSCAPQVDPGTARALIEVESGANPQAIGVVGGALVRQPKTRAEARATARALQSSGWNFSVGLAQINVRNSERLGLTLDEALEPCANLRAMQRLLIECFDRAAGSTNLSPPARQQALRRALSCYYSGDFQTGFRHGYVRRVAAASTADSRGATTQPKPLPSTPQEAS